MSESRKDWIAAKKIGTTIGWFGGSPEAESEPVNIARPREFETIVATAVPEEGLEILVEQLAPKGRLLVAVPFGAMYPSALVHQLRGQTIPIELDLVDGELRAAVEKHQPNVGSWQMFASPGRLLAMTERGANEREAKRSAELHTLRAAYQRLAERLMARASDHAGPAIAAASRVRALEEKVADLAARMRAIDESPDMRIGRALLKAAKSPREAVKLPARLMRAYVDSRQAPPALPPPPPPIDRELTSLVRRSHDRLALIVDGRTFAEAGGLERELAMEGWGVVLTASQESSEMRPAQRLLRSEIELFAEVFPTLEGADAAERVAVFRTPHPIAPRWINRLNAWGWITIYDCFEDWPTKLRLGVPHRYRRAVERFIVHNVDLLFATEACAARLRGFTTRELRIEEDLGAAARAKCLVEGARSVRTANLVEKGLHARDRG